jgi:hypothetical protein
MRNFLRSLVAVPIATVALAFAGALTAAAPVAAAPAPQVGPQFKVSGPGDKSPVTVPGGHLKRGQTLRANERLIGRKVTLHGNQMPILTLSCRDAYRHAGLTIDTEHRPQVLFGVVGKSNYAGKHTIRVRARARDRRLKTSTGVIYALCRK